MSMGRGLQAALETHNLERRVPTITEFLQHGLTKKPRFHRWDWKKLSFLVYLNGVTGVPQRDRSIMVWSLYG